MCQVRFCSAVLALLAGLCAARAEPVCDAPGEEGYRVVLSMEVTTVADGEPYQSGPDWIVERTTTLLPLCSYFNRIGSYSLKSYSLDPEKKTERVMLCHGDQRVGSYTGSCPPK
jgi:hypothetical protein